MKRMLQFIWIAPCLSALTLMAVCLPGHATEAIKGWVTPTPEELAMTSVPGVPGARALYLNREKITLDDLHVEQHYERLKVLTEKGKELATVRVQFYSSRSGVFERGDDKAVDTVSGRTIHADGSIVPFSAMRRNCTRSKRRMGTRQARCWPTSVATARRSRCCLSGWHVPPGCRHTRCW